MTKQTFNIRKEVETIIGRPLHESEPHILTSLRRIGYANPSDITHAIIRALETKAASYQRLDSHLYRSNAHMERHHATDMSRLTRSILFDAIDMKSRLIAFERGFKESGK